MFSIARKTQYIRKLCESVYCVCLVRNFTSHKVSNTTQLHAIKKPLLLNANQMRKLCSVKDDSATEICEPDLQAIAEGDPEIEHKLKVLILEVDVLRQEGCLVPDNSFMTTENWKDLLNLNSRTGRRKYLQYLFKKSKTKENQKKKKEQKWLEREAIPEPTPQEGLITYGLMGSNIFLRFYDSTMNMMYNNRLIQAMQFGQKLVFDCGYDEHMIKRENINCAKQLMLLFGDNRLHDDPYDIHLCNMNRDGQLRAFLKKQIPTLDDPDFPLYVHEKSYLDLFPKEKLVYLTPHCREEMQEYDHDAIYIIGAIVDKVNKEPLSLAKAKKENIRMQKFPLDKYLQWGDGSGKSLTLNQCLSILLDIKTTGDWNYALRHVPRRKLADVSMNRGFEDRRDIAEKREKRIKEFRRIWSPNFSSEHLSYNRKKNKGTTN